MSAAKKRTAIEQAIKEAEKQLKQLQANLRRIENDPAENGAPCFPYSPRAQKIMALHNGMAVDTMPESFRWASNVHMQAWMDLLGEALEAGRPHCDPDGHWWTVARLTGGSE